MQSTSGIVGHDYTSYPSFDNNRGNATQKTQWFNTGSSPVTKYTYDDTGQVLTMTDPNGHTTQYSYADNFTNGSPPGPTNAYLTKITYPTTPGANHVESFSYNYPDGQLSSSTDQNQQKTSYFYNDSLGRLTETDYPDSGKTSISYDDTPGAVSVTTTQELNANTNAVKTQSLDGVGHVTRNQLTSDPAGADDTDTTYDGEGRLFKVTNPYRTTSDPTYGTTTNTYDALGRIISAQRPDGNTATTSYSGNCATVIDEASKSRKTCTDGLGRATQVFEDPSGLNYETDYQYDALDNLTQVTQGSSQTRTYQYDMLSRLTSVTVPESGTTNFYYTTSGGGLCSGDASAVCRRTDARGVTTTYAYDALNRLTSKIYPDGTPTANFYYDEASVTLGGWSSPTLQNTAGRLTHTTVFSGTTLEAATVEDYDKMGRPADFWQCAPFDCSNSVLPPSQYTYDLAGDVVNYLTPSNGDFHITTTINAAQQVTEMDGNQIDNYHPKVLGQFTYTPFGALSQLTDGCTGTGCAGYIENYAYNNRLQPVMIELGTTSNPTQLSCWTYNYYLSVANPTTCAAPAQGTGNNGNVAGEFYLDNLNSLGHTSGYTYDSLNRLATAVATGNSTYNLTFVYNQDGSGRYGNMTCQTNQQTQGLCANVSFNAATNQISTAGYTYDAAGNMTADGAHTYQYDAEGRLATVDGGSTAKYVYNALGQRVDSVAAGPVYRETYYDAFGRTAVSQNHTTTLEDFFPPVAGRNYVKFEAGGTLFLHTEVRGTSGILTTQANGVWQDQVYYPLGQQWVPMNGGYDVRFGSLQERDAVTGLDPTPARDYNNNIGRWMTPDPLAGDISNPQSLNRYAYALNNPTTLIDPTGLNPFSEDPGGVQCRDATFAESHAQCQGPGSPWCFIFPTDAGCIYTPPISGGGGGGVGGGGGAGGTTTGGALPGRGIGSSGVDVGNAFLGFHLACSQTKLSVPGLPGGSVSPANCVLFFLNIRLNAYSVATDLTAAGLVIAGSVTVIVPVAGGAGVGPTFPFAFGTQGFGCLGAGGAFGTVGKAVNAGPIIGGDLGNYRNVLSGLSISVNAQSVSPLAGAQVIQNSSGLLYGPTFGTPGFSASASYSFCGTTP